MAEHYKMDVDDRLHWIETKVSSSLRPKTEELKQLVADEDNRACLLEFFDDEEKRHVYVFFKTIGSRMLTVSFMPGVKLSYKWLFLVKSPDCMKVTKENISNAVLCYDCSPDVLDDFERITEEVYLPLLSNEVIGGASTDKLMDLLHRIIYGLQIISGSMKGCTTLPIPAFNVLAKASSFDHRKSTVIHILETTLISWIKQIKKDLNAEPEFEINYYHGTQPEPSAELEFWQKRLKMVRSLNAQLCSPVAVNILTALEQASSTYAQSFHDIKRELAKGESDIEENLRFLEALVPWLKRLDSSHQVAEVIKAFGPFLHTILLIWQHSKYFHLPVNLSRLLRMSSNLVVNRAKAFVGEDITINVTQAHKQLRLCLQICAAFRGTYIDTKDKADVINSKKLAEQSELRGDFVGVVWHSSLYRTARTPRGAGIFEKGENLPNVHDAQDYWQDSPWPSRSDEVFVSINTFMERCNDVLELVEVTQQFANLNTVAAGGGAGHPSLDAQVQDVYNVFQRELLQFKTVVTDVFDVQPGQTFDKAFFSLRSSVRDLEMRLGDILHQGLKLCWDTESRIKLLSVFRGICQREFIQGRIRQTLDNFIHDVLSQVARAKEVFDSGTQSAHQHPHLPPVTSHILWLRSLTSRIQGTMSGLSDVAPQCLKGELGWRIRDACQELLQNIALAEKEAFLTWQESVKLPLVDKLKENLLVSILDSSGKKILYVNLDCMLQVQIREISYLSSSPLKLPVDEDILKIFQSIDTNQLQSLAAQLNLVTSRYNKLVIELQEIERPLVTGRLEAAEKLLQEGLHHLTWKDQLSADFVERSVNIICAGLYKTVVFIQSNRRDIEEIVALWTVAAHDVFSEVPLTESLLMIDLEARHRAAEKDISSQIESDGHRIHAINLSTFQVVSLSQSSPAWIQYVSQISKMIAKALHESIVSSLKNMLNRIVMTSLSTIEKACPFLQVDMLLVGSEICFQPPLDDGPVARSLPEYVHAWLSDFLSRSRLVKPVLELEDYYNTIRHDEEVNDLIRKINGLLESSINELGTLFELFKDYAFLWIQDVQSTFEDFLAGRVTTACPQNASHDDAQSQASVSESEMRETGSGVTSLVTTSNMTIKTAVANAFERNLLSKNTNAASSAGKPTLDDFDREINFFESCQEELKKAPSTKDLGWIRVNLHPVKQMIATHASKWMHTYTDYLSNQVLQSLSSLDAFLRRVEPAIEAITGQERDVHAFMKLMRIFNEVSAQQAELDNTFVAMKKMIGILEKHGQRLPELTQKFYGAAPMRWNNLKMKVSQAKQKLGPRIQAESASVVKCLRQFSKKCHDLEKEIQSSAAFRKDCLLQAAYSLIESFAEKLEKLDKDALDLIELQELLEQEVVDFSVTKRLRLDLSTLRNVWDTYKLIKEQQTEWKRHRWRKIRTRVLRRGLDAQYEIVKQLPDQSQGWDITTGIIEMINEILACLPIMDDLGKGAMRPRHWKQLVRAIGGTIEIGSDGLGKMSLQELMDLGLQNHTEEVREIVKKSTKDVSIENTLKSYEEVWLSKVFELRPHTRLSGDFPGTASRKTPASELGCYESDLGGRFDSITPQPPKSSHPKVTIGSDKASSILSVPPSATTEAAGAFAAKVKLLHNVGPILEELESHQVSLQAMMRLAGANPFSDDIYKWQKTLQNVELTICAWMSVQEKWLQLDEVFNSSEARILLPHEVALFSSVNREFCANSVGVASNPNVLQTCSKPNILSRLERMNTNLEQCQKSIKGIMHRRMEKFPRLYLLTESDAIKVMCFGYDPGQLTPFLPKLFSQVYSLTYSMHNNLDSKLYQLTGFKSIHGEPMQFEKLLSCEGQVEDWLSSFESYVKQSIRLNAAVVLDSPLTDSLAAFATASPLSAADSQIAKKAVAPKEKPPAKVTLFDDTGSKKSHSSDHTKAYVLNYLLRPVMSLPKSWTIESGSDSVTLSLKVICTRLLHVAFESFKSGDKQAFSKVKTQLSTVVTVLGDFLLTQSTIHAFMEGDPDSKQHHLQMTATKINELNYVMVQSESIDAAVQSKDISRAASEYMLKPYQLKLIENLIILFLNELDFVRNFIEVINAGTDISLGPPLPWHVHPWHFWNSDGCLCSVSVGAAIWEYGFNFQGTRQEVILTPALESTLAWIASGAKQLEFGLICGCDNSGDSQLVRHFAHTLGLQLHDYVCASTASPSVISNLVRGCVSTGSWLCLHGVNELTGSVLVMLGQFLKAVRNALIAKEARVSLGAADVPLLQSAMVFASAHGKHSHLPWHMRGLFRSVSYEAPDLKRFFEVSLVKHGLVGAVSLIPKICRVLRSLQNIFSCYSTGLSISQLDLVCYYVKCHFMRLLSESSSLEMAKRLSQGSEQDKEPPDEEHGRISGTSSKFLIRNLFEPTEAVPSSEDFKELEAMLLQKSVVLALIDFSKPSLQQQSIRLFKMILIEELPMAASVLSEASENMHEMGPTTAENASQADDEDSENGADEGAATFAGALNAVLARRGLTTNSALINDLLDLSKLVAHSRVVLLTGSHFAIDEYTSIFLDAHKLYDQKVSSHVICPQAMKSQQLFGFVNTDRHQWEPGALPTVLHEVSKAWLEGEPSEHLCFIVVDGPLDDHQINLFEQVMYNNEFLHLPNGDKMIIPPNVKFLWQLQDPVDWRDGTLRRVATKSIEGSAYTWRTAVQTWLHGKPTSCQDYLLSLIEEYVPRTLDYLKEEGTVPADEKNPLGQLRHIIPMSDSKMVKTMIQIFEAVTGSHVPLVSDYDTYFNYSALWSFGGGLIADHRMYFAQWWRKNWDSVSYPDDSEVWNFVVNPESHLFIHIDNIVQYSGNPGTSVKCKVVKNSSSNMAISYLMGVLADDYKPVLLAGPTGYGKSSIAQKKFLSEEGNSGDICTLSIYANNFLTADALWTRLNECLEWKHSNCYVPQGDKRLLCIVDDIHQAQIESRCQPSTELLNQILKRGGAFNPLTRKWQTVQNAAFVATFDPFAWASTAYLTRPLIDGFIVINVPCPSFQDQMDWFENILAHHFISSGDRQLLLAPGEENVDSATINRRVRTEELMNFLSTIVAVTIEVQENMRAMFLPTPARCCYVFTLSEITRVFEHLCMLLTTSASTDDILRTWYHAMHWVYFSRLVDEVDQKRWLDVVHMVAKKRLNKFQLEVLLQPLYVITKTVDNIPSASVACEPANNHGSQCFHFVDDMQRLREVLNHHMCEYNSQKQRMRIILYEDTIRCIFRLLHVLQSPRTCGSALLLSEGSPGITNSFVILASFICGMEVFAMNPSTVARNKKYKLEHFQHDLVNCFIRAGVKQEKLVLCITDMDLVDDHAVAFIADFMTPGSLTHLFSESQRSSIVNSIRTEVVEAGVGVTREFAWGYFLRSLRENLHIILNLSSTGARFREICCHHPSLITSLQTIRVPHWNYQELVNQAMFHLSDLRDASKAEQENLAYLLASMHCMVRKHDPSLKADGMNGNITNTTYVKFVQRFIEVLKRKQGVLLRRQQEAQLALTSLNRSSEVTSSLAAKLEHERVVLEQKRSGNHTLLSQIGQDQAITEEQVHLVRKQNTRISSLEKLLPQYEEAQKRAVFKAAAIVKETKKVLAELSHEGLVELRAMQKPDSEIEDVLAAIIIIVKSPTSDLTWHRGAKRIMANLERFKEDLSAFDLSDLPEQTMQAVHPYLKRPHFTPRYLAGRTRNPALGSLVLYVRGVIRYNFVMQSRVKPLHQKVMATSAALAEAKEKLSMISGKLSDFNDRLENLSKKYECASVEKSKQRLLTEDQEATLSEAAKFKEALLKKQSAWEATILGMKQSSTSLFGAVALAVGLVTYLMPYDYVFRESMLVRHWPKCLEERGIAFGDGPTTSPRNNLADAGIGPSSEENQNHEWVTTSKPGLFIDEMIETLAETLVGEDVLRSWLTRSLATRELENLLAIHVSLANSLFLVDPAGQSKKLLRYVVNWDDVVELDISQSTPTFLAEAERAVTAGSTLVITNVDDEVDAVFLPLIRYLAAGRSSDYAGPNIIKLNNHRLQVHSGFRLIFICRSFSPAISCEYASLCSVVNMRPTAESIHGIVRSMTLGALMPELAQDLQKFYFSLFMHQKAIRDIDLRLSVLAQRKHGQSFWSDTHLVTCLMEKRLKLRTSLSRVEAGLKNLKSRCNQCDTALASVGWLYSILSVLPLLSKQYTVSTQDFVAMFQSCLENGNLVLQADPKFIYEAGVNDLSQEDKTSVKSSLSFDQDLLQIAPPVDNEEEDREGFSFESPVTNEDQGPLSEFVDSEIPMYEAIEFKPVCVQKIKDYVRNFTEAMMNHLKRVMTPTDFQVFLMLYGIYTKQKNMPGTRDFFGALLQQGACMKENNAFVAFKRPVWLPSSSYVKLIDLASKYPPFGVVFQYITEHSEVIRCWYEKPLPEKSVLSFPGMGTTQANDLYILTVMVLRPDRLYHSLMEWSLALFPDDFTTSSDNQLSVAGSVALARPTLISGECDAAAFVAETKVKTGLVADLKHHSVHDCSFEALNSAINTTISENAWLVVTGLELVTLDFLMSLYNKLECAYSTKDSAVWQIYLASTDIRHFPTVLIGLCDVLSSSTLCEDDATSDVSWSAALKRQILGCIKAIPKETWLNDAFSPLFVRRLLFSLCVLHGYVLAQLYFDGKAVHSATAHKDLGHAFVWVGTALTSRELNQGLLDELLFILEHNIYRTYGVNSEMVNELAREIVSNTVIRGVSYISIDSLSIPFPPKNVDPASYGDWLNGEFEQLNEQNLFGGSSSMKEDRLKQINLKRSSSFFSKLQLFYGAAIGEHVRSADSLDANLLSDAVELCFEQLPQPFMLSTLSAPSDDDVDSSFINSLKDPGKVAWTCADDIYAYLIREEGLKFNCKLSAIKATIEEIKHALPSGLACISDDVASVGKELVSGYAPVSWLSPVQRGVVCPLATYLKGLIARHKVLKELLSSGFLLKSGRAGLPIRLSVLENPGAFVHVAKYQTAQFLNCPFEEIGIYCRFTGPDSKVSASSSLKENSPLLIADDLGVLNASVTVDNECVLDVPKTPGWQRIPLAYLWCDRMDTSRSEQKFPLYANSSQKDPIFHLLMKSKLTTQKRVLLNPVFILFHPDIGDDL